MKLCLLLITILLGALETWVNRYAISADGVSYLDLGDAWWRADWALALNGYWSPLYPWLQGAAGRLFQPAPEWAYPLAHLVNFLTWLGALAAFDFFLRELLRARPTERRYLPRWLMLTAGYLIFCWVSLVLTPQAFLTPDLCVAALVYLAAGLLLRLRREPVGREFALLGLALGGAYVAKAAMFPLAFIFLAVSVRRRSWPQALAGLACFALVAAPFVSALSLSKGRLTFGDNGKLNYAWHINDLPPRHWQGGAQPTRMILTTPAIYEFGAPLRATYPVWYDASYWYEGVSLHFSLNKQAKVFARHVRSYLSFFSLRGSLLVLGLLLLLILRKDRRRLAHDIGRYWFLLLPSLAGLALYALVHVEGRYVASFFVLILLSVLAGVSLPAQHGKLTLAAVCAVLLLSLGPALLRLQIANVRELGNAQNDYWRTAAALQQLGVTPGAQIVTLGYANPFHARWARLAGARIVAELYDEQEAAAFWTADEASQERVIAAFRQTGASVLVAANAPPERCVNGWRQAADERTCVYFLKKQYEPF